MTGGVAPRVVTALTPDSASFAPFGRVVTLDSGALPDVVVTAGSGWTDAYTRSTLTRETPSLGMTSAPGMPFTSTRMERHANVEEALLPAASAIVLAVAEATDGDAPRAEDVRAFVVAHGTAVVLKPGVWHDACRGLDGPTSYYWLSSCVDAGSSPWTPIAGGPVDVRVKA
ncbi:ureidoglycolate lyase [Microterricola gilva]|uniref:Ureidoglycolate lyase n=1 Tax=Microterricola gilva TaxID=393267 RepID=A0A4Q8ALE8_9MICO|nr:ureidoglycolate lyase [Microterricola gilva]RZU65390.1 ureidoglycolate lyase [Microterricola gilva]